MSSLNGPLGLGKCLGGICYTLLSEWGGVALAMSAGDGCKAVCMGQSNSLRTISPRQPPHLHANQEEGREGGKQGKK